MYLYGVVIQLCCRGLFFGLVVSWDCASGYVLDFISDENHHICH